MIKSGASQHVTVPTKLKMFLWRLARDSFPIEDVRKHRSIGQKLVVLDDGSLSHDELTRLIVTMWG